MKKREIELTSDLFERNTVNLYNFSEDLTNIFFIKASWLPKIYQKFFIPFENIFEKVSS